MQITMELPNDFTQHPDPAREAVEALAITRYRAGMLTAYQASENPATIRICSCRGGNPRESRLAIPHSTSGRALLSD